MEKQQIPLMGWEFLPEIPVQCDGVTGVPGSRKGDINDRRLAIVHHDSCFHSSRCGHQVLQSGNFSIGIYHRSPLPKAYL
jgi:hypothetical protein